MIRRLLNYRPTPTFIVALIVITCLAYITWVIPDTLARWHFNQQAQEALAPTPQYKYGPDISHCLVDEATQPLWDCIRHVKED